MKNKNARTAKAATSANTGPHPTTKQPPPVSGQLAEVLEILHQRQQVLRLELTHEHGITEAPARVCELRDLGFHVVTVTEPEIVYRGRVHRRVARYSLGVPSWPAPGFLGEEAA